MLDLDAVFFAGLPGSVHCAGMCGRFLARLHMGAGRAAGDRQGPLFAGKTATYAAFGSRASAAAGVRWLSFSASSTLALVEGGTALALVAPSLLGTCPAYRSGGDCGEPRIEGTRALPSVKRPGSWRDHG